MSRKGKGTLYSTADLFRIINEQLKKDDLLPEHLDYGIPDHDDVKVKSNEWDCIFIVNFGGSEGIYLDIYLHGNTGNEGYGDTSVGTYKTLRTDKEAYKDLAALGTEFVFALKDFVREHSEDFEWSGYKVSFYSGEDKKMTYITCEAELKPLLTRTFKLDKYDKAVIHDNWAKSDHTVTKEEYAE